MFESPDLSGFATNRDGLSVNPYRTFPLDLLFSVTSGNSGDLMGAGLALKGPAITGFTTDVSVRGTSDEVLGDRGGDVGNVGNVGDLGDLGSKDATLPPASAMLSYSATLAATPEVTLRFGGAFGGGGMEDNALLYDSSLLCVVMGEGRVV